MSFQRLHWKKLLKNNKVNRYYCRWMLTKISQNLWFIRLNLAAIISSKEDDWTQWVGPISSKTTNNKKLISRTIRTKADKFNNTLSTF